MLFSPAKKAKTVGLEGVAIEKPKRTVKCNLFTMLVFLHNTALMVFSGAVVYYTFPFIYNSLNDFGYDEGMCIFRREGYSNFLFFAYFFYLSKFYEVFDTIILMVKGTRPELLQTYHHAGAMIGMWWALNADSPGLWFFVCENAFVHAIMYFYYAMSTIGISVPGKMIITTMQILQFFIGIFGSATYYFNVTCNCNLDMLYAIAYNQIYATLLVVLFAGFYIRNYCTKGSKKAAKVHEAGGKAN